MPFGVLALSGRMARWRGTDTNLMGGETCSGASVLAGPLKRTLRLLYPDGLVGLKAAYTRSLKKSRPRWSLIWLPIGADMILERPTYEGSLALDSSVRPISLHDRLS